VRWRSLNRRLADVPPDQPWPARVEAFKVACAIHAGQRERDVTNALETLAASLGG
jgi:hypothetical protein